MNRFFFPFALFISSLMLAQQTDEEKQISAQFNLNYDLRILDNPVHVRTLFRNDFSFSESYLKYVTQQNPTWYLHYFSRNTMQRYGWRNHWELYQERFLVWSDWLQNPFRFRTLFDWNRPRHLFDFLTPALSPLESYSQAFFAENWLIQQRINQLKADDTLEENYGTRSVVANTEHKKIQTSPHSLHTLVTSLKERGVAIETHKRKAFVPLDERKGYSSRTREIALERLQGSNSPTARNYDSKGPSKKGGRYYGPPVNQAPVRTVVQDVSTTSMGNSGGSTTVSAGREQ